MSVRVGIYGIGRTARQLIYKAVTQYDDFIALVCLVELERRTLEQIVQYLSNTTEDNLGWADHTISWQEQNDRYYIVIDGRVIPVIYEQDPVECVFGEYSCDYVVSTTIPAEFEITDLAQWRQRFILAGAKETIIVTDVYQSSPEYYLYGIKNFPTAKSSLGFACIPNGEDSAYYYAVEIINQISGCTVTSVNGTMLARGVNFSSGDSFNSVNLKHNISEDFPSNISNLGAIFSGLSSVPARSSKYRVDTQNSLILVDLVVQNSGTLAIDEITYAARAIAESYPKGILGYIEQDDIEEFNTERFFGDNISGSYSYFAPVVFNSSAVKLIPLNTGYYMVRMVLLAIPTDIICTNIYKNLIYRESN